MSELPAHRQILQGRTHGRTWSPADADPVQFYPQTRISKLAGFALAAGIGAALAALVAYSI